MSISLDNYDADIGTHLADQAAVTESTFIRFGGPSPNKMEMMSGMNGDNISYQFASLKPDMQI